MRPESKVGRKKGLSPYKTKEKTYRKALTAWGYKKGRNQEYHTLWKIDGGGKITKSDPLGKQGESEGDTLGSNKAVESSGFSGETGQRAAKDLKFGKGKGVKSQCSIGSRSTVLGGMG